MLARGVAALLTLIVTFGAMVPAFDGCRCIGEGQPAMQQACCAARPPASVGRACCERFEVPKAETAVRREAASPRLQQLPLVATLTYVVSTTVPLSRITPPSSSTRPPPLSPLLLTTILRI